jgi:hypothetical protein
MMLDRETKALRRRSSSLSMPRFSSHRKKTDIQRKKTREFETPKQTMTLSSLSLFLSLSLEEIKSIVVGTTSLGLATGKTSSSSSPTASSSPEELIFDAAVASSTV